MKYQISITKKEIVRQEVKEYERLRSAYPDDMPSRMSREEREKDPEYGYVATEKDVEVTTQVLSQEVDDLDLKEVIKAINKL